MSKPLKINLTGASITTACNKPNAKENCIHSHTDTKKSPNMTMNLDILHSTNSPIKETKQKQRKRKRKNKTNNTANATHGCWVLEAVEVVGSVDAVTVALIGGVVTLGRVGGRVVVELVAGITCVEAPVG